MRWHPCKPAVVEEEEEKELVRPPEAGHKPERSFVRSFSALMLKNVRLRKSDRWGMLAELLLPVLFLILMGYLSAGAPNQGGEIIPYPNFTVPPLSYFVGQATSYPNVLCYDNNLFRRCSCAYPKTTPPWLEQGMTEKIGRYYSKGLKYPVEAQFASMHASPAYTVLCFMYQGLIGATKTVEDALSNPLFNVSTTALCEVAQGAFNFCPGDLANYDFEAIGCPDINKVFVYDTDEITALIKKTVKIGNQLRLGVSIPEDYVDRSCETNGLALAPLDGSGSSANELAKGFYAYLTETAPGIEMFLQNFSSADAIQQYVTQGSYWKDQTLQRLSSAIVFTGEGAPAYEYTIRANFSHDFSSNEATYISDNVPPTRVTEDPKFKSGFKIIKAGQATVFPFVQTYFQSGVLSLQRAVDSYLMTLEGVPEPTYRVANIASPAYKHSSFWETAGALFSVIFVIILKFPVGKVIESLVMEKEFKIKEVMMQMGLGPVAYNLAWVVWFVVIFTILALVLALMGVYTIFKKSQYQFVFGWFFLFFLATIAMCFFVATLFSNARTASTYGSLLFFVTVFPYFALSTESSHAALMGACVVPTLCFAVGTFPFQQFETSGQGVTTYTWRSTEGINISMAEVLFMLFIDTIIFTVLAWYAGEVIPSEWGTHRPFYFLFTKSYWRPEAVIAESKERIAELYMEDETRDHSQKIQMVDDGLRSQLRAQGCVALRGLKKTYKSKTGGEPFVAVKELTLTMYSGQITALLGHNGAGKTTTLNMLTGMIPISGGAALVQGKDACAQMHVVREDLGVCPQHDVLFPTLTVKDHLELYAAIKGVPRAAVAYEVERMIRVVGLTEKRHEPAGGLSGGQKRKLSVAIAFIGGSRVVVLDEPSSGMDPHSRRFMWDVIRQQKEGRVIILTTHFMDEADLLGDRVAIMSHGELKCVGSSLFLKRAYGAGYNLTVVKEVAELGGAGGARRDAEQRQAIKALVHSYVKRSVVLSDVGAEVSFQLPTSSSGRFQAMLNALDGRRNELGVSSYGMGITTLEEVFLRVASGTGDPEERASVRQSVASMVVRRQTLAPGRSTLQGGQHSVGLKEALAEAHAEAKLLGPSSYFGQQETKTDESFLTTTTTAAGAAATAAHSESVAGAAAQAQAPGFEVGSGFEAGFKSAQGAAGQGDGAGGLDVGVGETHKVYKPIPPEKQGKWSRFWRHVRTLIIKRGLTFMRDKKAIGFTLFAPSFFFLLGQLILLAGHLVPDQTPLLLSPAAYNTKGSPNPQNPFYYPPGACFHNFQFNYTPPATCDPAAFVDAALAVSDGSWTAEPQGDISSANTIQELNTLLLATDSDYKASRFGAAVFNVADIGTGEMDVTIIANYTGLHAAPTFLNQMANGALGVAAAAAASEAAPATISLTMYPFPATQREKLDNDDDATFPTVLFLLVGTAFLPAAWAGYVVRERETKSKHQQVVCGVSLNAYWFSNYAWDLAMFLPTPCVALLLVELFGVKALTHDGGAGAMAALLFMWGPANLGFTYMLSFAFATYTSAISGIMFIDWLVGLIGATAIYIMQLFEQSTSLAKALKWVLRIFPSFCLGDGMLNLGSRFLISYIYGASSIFKPWNIDIVLADIIYMAAGIVVYGLAVYILERVFSGTKSVSAMMADRKLRKRFGSAAIRGQGDKLWNGDLATDTGIMQEDEDVVMERRRVKAQPLTWERPGRRANRKSIVPAEQMSQVHRRRSSVTSLVKTSIGYKRVSVLEDPEAQEEADAIITEGMRKVYPASHKGLKFAVRDMWLGIPRGECFGLLGINGAGKSTTISILCGEQLPTQGKALLSGYDIVEQPEAIHKLVGYCPQFDALFDTMTSREHLTLYARIKGIPESKVKEAVEQQIREMNLVAYADKLSGGYSGGNKRKLSVAVAMLGSPEIVFLDEPSTGVDPMARRFMWNVINKIVTQNRESALVLTTHSMEEAEALCQRIGIMVGGRLRCLGSCQHLKSRFGKGFQLEATVTLPGSADLLPAERRLREAVGSAAAASGSVAIPAAAAGSSVAAAAAAAAGSVAAAGVESGAELTELTSLKQVAAALSAYPQLALKVQPDGEEAGLYNILLQSLLSHGSVRLSELAVWCVLDDRCRAVQSFMARSFEGAALQEKQGHRMRFDLPSLSGQTLGDIFGLLEQNRQSLLIEEYALGQSSLEQIFNFFAAQQAEEALTGHAAALGGSELPSADVSAGGLDAYIGSACEPAAESKEEGP